MNLRKLEHLAQQMGGIFSLQQLKLYENNFLRSNLVRREKQGYLKRVTKGRYFLTSQSSNEITLYQISNQIYTPSYISMESALRYYDLIPEGVYTTTACTTKKTQTLSGELGTFYYSHIKPSLFWGYSLMSDETTKRTYLLADVEKALCDFFYLKPHLTKTDFSGLRIDGERLRELTTPERLQKYADAFKIARLSTLMQHFISFLHS